MTYYVLIHEADSEFSSVSTGEDDTIEKFKTCFAAITRAKEIAQTNPGEDFEVVQVTHVVRAPVGASHVSSPLS